MLSTHIPAMAGGEVSVVGEVAIKHQLRDLQTFVATFKSANFVPNQEGKVSWYVLDPHTVIVRVEKTGSNEGVLGTNAVDISWLALGR